MDNHTRNERVAMLCDELLRRGVPQPAVQPVIDWLDAQRVSMTETPQLGHDGHLWANLTDGRQACVRCGSPSTRIFGGPCLP